MKSQSGEAMKKELKKYYRQIRRKIPLGLCDRHRIMESIESGVQEYLVQNPESDMTQIEEHFGTPNQIVSDFFDDQSCEYLLKALNNRKRIIVFSLFAIVIVLLLCLLYPKITSIILNTFGHNIPIIKIS